MQCSSRPRLGEKDRNNFFSFYAFLEDHSSLTYRIRRFIEAGFQVKKEAVKSELDLSEIVLDVACGEGFIAGIVPQMRYLGVDMSHEVLKHAIKRNNACFFAMSGAQLGLKNESLVNCIAMDMFHHIGDGGVDTILMELQRVLKKKGKLLVTDPVRTSLGKDPFNFLLQKMDRGNYFRAPDELEIRFLKFY